MSVLFCSVVLINRIISQYVNNCYNNPESSIIISDTNDLQCERNGEIEKNENMNVMIKNETNDISDIVNSLIDSILHTIMKNRSNIESRKIVKSVIDSVIEKIEINLSYSVVELKKTNSLSSIESDFYNISPFTSITSITTISTNADSTPINLSNKIIQSFDSTESVLGDMDEFDENTLEKDMEDDNKKSQQSFSMHFDDFILSEPLNFSEVFFSTITHEYISSEKSHKHIIKNISVIITFIIESDIHPNVATIFIQLVIRFLVNNTMSPEEFLYFVILAFRFACILEYDRTVFEDIKFLGENFRLNFNKLIVYEEKLFKILDYRLHLDNIFNHFTEKEMFFLCHDKKCQKEYYKFICDIDIYLRSSKYNTELFRNLHLKNINDISD